MEKRVPIHENSDTFNDALAWLNPRLAAQMVTEERTNMSMLTPSGDS
jgi:hypothetical protein